MARIRTVKPEFWANEELSELPEATHILACALLNHADDEGYFRANPALVRAACFPLREPSVSIHGALKQLAEVGYISVHTGSDGKAYGRIVKFTEHQKINRPTASKIKELVSLSESSVSPHGVLMEPSLPERKGKGRKGDESKEATATAAPFDFKADLFKRWKAIPESGGGAFLNKLFRDHKPEQRVVEAIEHTLDHEPADPKAFVVGVLKREAKIEAEADDAIRGWI